MDGWMDGWMNSWMDGWKDDTETTVGYQRRGIKGRNKLYPQTLHSESLNSWAPQRGDWWGEENSTIHSLGI